MDKYLLSMALSSIRDLISVIWSILAILGVINSQGVEHLELPKKSIMLYFVFKDNE